MATQYTANIKFDRIVDMGIWMNNKDKSTLATVYSKLQAKYPGKEVYISNAGYFEFGSLRPCMGLKADGVMQSDDWFAGFLAFESNKIAFGNKGLKPLSWKHGISGYPVLIENGVKSPNFSYCTDNTDRGRTMFGYTNDSVVLSVIADVPGSSDFTLDEEVTFMKNLGCRYAINLDGGGSSQCNFNGSKINSTRIVSNFVYIIAEKLNQSTITTTTTSLTNNSTTFTVGSIIKLKAGAKYTTGSSIPAWVINSTTYCRSINSNGTITFSTSKTGAITGIVAPQYIEGASGVPTTSSTSSTSSTTTSANNSSGYKAKVTASVLNVRANAGTSYAIVGSLKNGTIVTVVENKNGWSKLSDGKGWVSSTYLKKV